MNVNSAVYITYDMKKLLQRSAAPSIKMLVKIITGYTGRVHSSSQKHRLVPHIGTLMIAQMCKFKIMTHSCELLQRQKAEIWQKLPPNMHR